MKNSVTSAGSNTQLVELYAPQPRIESVADLIDSLLIVSSSAVVCVVNFSAAANPAYLACDESSVFDAYDTADGVTVRDIMNGYVITAVGEPGDGKYIWSRTAVGSPTQELQDAFSGFDSYASGSTKRTLADMLASFMDKLEEGTSNDWTLVVDQSTSEIKIGEKVDPLEDGTSPQTTFDSYMTLERIVPALAQPFE